MTTIAKSNPRIMAHNMPLAEKLKKQGARFKINNNLGSFRKADGSYVPYPNGYITGPSEGSSGREEFSYVSVQTSTGWRQRTTKGKSLAEIIDWALTEAKKHID